MDGAPTDIESELLDLSSVTIATLRKADLAGLDAATTRVVARIADTEGSISGYSGSFSGRMRPDSEAPADRVD
ncbi:hypothetical protein ACFO1B_33375 [Dactylosporangium siamense]|uniref:Uncharacterized protein n=1 Tax=Dactylosporangium siamense TaxID=685454 RepID=A0A919U881_9ACTN|nr:hypothetical protein [Dactylosporangium siamense]GIG42505.1 hypothetical protein Dsi01nite_005460 [Dactylosporangium siamense]